MRRVLASLAAFAALSPAVLADDPPVELSDIKPGVVYLAESGPGGKSQYRPASEPVPLTAIDPTDRRAQRTLRQLVCDDVTIHVAAMPTFYLARLDPAARNRVGVAVLVILGSDSTAKRRDYTRWVDAKMTDDLGNAYDQVAVEKLDTFGAVAKDKTRFDGTAGDVLDVLAFERPVPAAKKFTIELPGENVVIKPAIRLAITREVLDAAEANAEKRYGKK